jgi:diguanylate cyclase (GGDEF)-like protein
MMLVTVGWWLMRLRVRPLITGISTAYAAESRAMARFDAAMQSSPDGFVIAENIKNEEGDIVDFRCVYLNRHAELIASHYFGKQGNLLGNSFFQVFPNQRDVFEKFKTVALTKKILVDELSVFSHEGVSIWFQRQTVPMANGIAVTYRDITQQKNLVQQLEYSNKLRTAIVEGAAYSIISTDVEGTILTFNQAAERMLWYRADELVGKATPGVFHDAEEVKSRAISLSQELGYTVAPGFDVFVAKAKIHFQEGREWTYVRKDGSRFPVKLSVSALRDAQGQLEGFLGIAYDISEQKRSEEYIRHIALHDVLTGLPNRALLDDRVKVAIEQQRRNNIPFALAMMDIDRFKYINDTMGHHIGDRVLKEFVQRVKSCLRPTDTLARMGGDEFVLLLAESEEMGAKIVMERIRNTLSSPINVGLQEVHITSSIGISICPRDGHDMNELLRRADVAMYWVKEHGRNGYKIFLAEMDSGAVDRLGLERELHVALEKGGFTLFYQPQVDLKTNTVLGVEALLRMRKIDGQYVSPADFIPLAEEIGLIVQIGQWVLQTACQDAARLQKMLGLPLGIVVNISPRQFVNGELVNQVQDALQRANLDAGLLELEITEGVLMDERNGVSSSLSELHNMGVKIAIDDFGTGYSSLSYLKRYPINRLKIDQSFVRDISSDSGDAALVVAIIAMGHSLNIPVIAEGIESAEQLAFLIANNCNFGQGFYIGRPMPFDNLQQWFANESRWKLAKSPTTA